jgi:hypothetical protein
LRGRRHSPHFSAATDNLLNDLIKISALSNL